MFLYADKEGSDQTIEKAYLGLCLGAHVRRNLLFHFVALLRLRDVVSQ